MKFTTTYKKWDIILVPFPFTNLKSTKKRPALIISPDEYNEKLYVVIAFITSKLDIENRLGDYKIKEWEKSAVKISRLRSSTLAIMLAVCFTI